MTIKIKIDDRTGAVKKIKANVGENDGRTRMNRAALKLWRGEAEPTTGYKFRRFFRRLFAELSTKAEAAYAYHLVGSPQACEISYIGLEERYDHA